MSKENQTSTQPKVAETIAAQPEVSETIAPKPKVVELDLHGLLGMLLKSQAESASLQRRILERELAKDDAIKLKDAEAQARIARDRKQLHDQMMIMLDNKKKRADRCTHEDQKGGSTLFPISNWPDRQLRGLCTQCPIFIEPQHIEVDANGKKTLVPEHPLYQKVLQRDQALYSDQVFATSY
jgi:hypothetical protein